MKPDVSLFFPVYQDAPTVRRVAEKSLAILAEVADDREVIIIDDGSTDESGAIADQLAREYPDVRVVHHQSNRGYGAALMSGFAAARFEWICFTDGDDEYDVFDLRRLIRHKESYDLIITFRYVKRYSSFRCFVSWVYNVVLRLLFRSPFRDISSGLRLVRKSLIDDLALDSTSPFIGAEITIKAMLKGYRIGEVGIQTFPRVFGHGATVTPKNILATIRDLIRIYRRIFSPEYELPEERRA